MRLRWTGLRRAPLASEVSALLPAGESVLAHAVEASGLVVVAGAHQVYAVRPAAPGLADGGGADLVLARGWHLVDGGSWDPEADDFTLTWVDRAEPVRWRFADPDSILPVVRERVQTSVVLAEPIEVAGRASVGRAVVRRHSGNGDLLSQAVLARGARMSDPEVAAAVRAAVARVREQVGLE